MHATNVIALPREGLSASSAGHGRPVGVPLRPRLGLRQHFHLQERTPRSQTIATARPSACVADRRLTPRKIQTASRRHRLGRKRDPSQYGSDGWGLHRATAAQIARRTNPVTLDNGDKYIARYMAHSLFTVRVTTYVPIEQAIGTR